MVRPLQAALGLILTLWAGTALAEPEHKAPEHATASGAPAAAPESVQAPSQLFPPRSAAVQMLRTLQLLQDQIGLGSTEAYAAQRGLLTVLDKRFMELEPATWSDEDNLRAAIAFVLSGGKPQLLRKILALDTDLVPVSRRSVIEGALAYVEGREEEARRSLTPIDVTLLPASFGAQIALVQSALAVRAEPRRSMELLDWVRLVAPGTLLEEGALRREVFVASELDDSGKFEALTIRYIRQFRNSVYAGNFRQRLAAVLARIDFGKDPERFDRVVTILKDFDVAVQRDLFLIMARASVDQGHVQSALMTAQKALELSRDDPASAVRARLYSAAARVVEVGSLEKSIQALKGIDRTALPSGDVALLDSALALAQRIRLTPDTPAATEKGQIAVAESGKPPQAPEQLPALLKAQEALRRVDELIKN